MKNQSSEPRKIGILSFYYPHLGGSGMVSTRLAKHLAERGHEIHFIGYDTDENPPEMENLGVRLHRVNRVDYPCIKEEPYIWTLASRLCDVDAQFGLDLVHANYAVPHALAAFTAREKLRREGRYLPYVVTGHGSDIHTNGSKSDVNPILQLCLNEADALTFVSRDLQEIAQKSLGIIKDSTVVPNFVDTNQFYKKDTDYKRNLGIPENAFVIGHVSNFAPIKRTYRFLYLAQHLKADAVLDNIYFLMCGDGRDRANLEERISRIGASDHFKFVGKIDHSELPEAYNAMDAMLLTSEHEGNPLVFLEAMACQIPLIGTDVGGISEAIDEDVGFLFDPQNISELSGIIHKLKNDRGLCARLGERGLRRVQRENSVEKVVGKYLEVFSSVLSKK